MVALTAQRDVTIEAATEKHNETHFKQRKKMENELRDALKSGKDVSVKIEVGYPTSGGVRPNEFVVTSYVDGERIIRRFYQ